jgi:hypothetical protein
MAGRSAILSVKIITDSSGATKGLDNAAGRIGRLEQGFGRLQRPATLAFGALAVGAKKAIDSASELQQAVGGVEAVFGKSAGQVLKWGEGAADSVGLAASEYDTFATQIGASLRNAGVPMDQLGGKTNDLITRGADLSSMFGGTTAEAVQAMGAALRGEYDPLERYGSSLTEAAVNAKLAADGNDKLEGSALAQAKVQARLALLMEQTALAQGNFAKEASTAAGQQQRAAAAYENTKAALGEALLPAYTELMRVLAQVATWVGENTTLVGQLVGVLAGLAATVTAVNVAFKAWRAISAAITAVSVAMKALSASTLATRVGLAALAVQQRAVAAGAAIASAATTAWSAVQRVATVVSAAFGVAARAAWVALTGPIGLVVVAITAVIAIVVALWNKNEGFRSFVIGAWNAIKTVALAVWNAIKAAAVAVLNALKSAGSGLVSFFKGAWTRLKNNATAAWNGVKSVVTSVFKALRSAGQAFGAFMTSVWNKIKAAAQKVWGWIKSFVMLNVAVMKSGLQVFQRAAVAVWNAVKAAASRVWSAIKGIVSRAVAGIKATFNTLKAATSAVWRAISSAAKGPLGVIKRIVDGIKAAFDAVAGAVQSVVGWIGRIRFPQPPEWLSKAGGAIAGVFSSSAPAPAPAAFSARSAASTTGLAPRLGTRVLRSSSRRTSGGGNVVINVTGGLDSADTIARRIESILRDRARRTGQQGVIGRAS